jgi:23S rRNA pseudouridine2605 synthase
MNLQRLQKVMAACGVGSRRHCETLIAEGRVQVDGQIVTEAGTKVDADEHEIRCDGQRLRMPQRFYYLLHKPQGVICSQKGDPNRPKAIDFLPPRVRDHRLYTIGRLDVESEGAIILTNDGDLCHRVTHPRFEVEKTYLVEIEGVPDNETVAKMRRGVWLSEGRTSSLQIRMVRRFRERSVLEMTLNEGMKREIRRVCARFGHEVVRLLRVAVGPVKLGELMPGETRPLTNEELTRLRDVSEVVIRLGAQQPAAARKRSRTRERGQPFIAKTSQGSGGSSGPTKRRRSAGPSRHGRGSSGR